MSFKIISKVSTLAKKSLEKSEQDKLVQPGDIFTVETLVKQNRHYVVGDEYLFEEHYNIIPSIDAHIRQIERLSNYCENFDSSKSLNIPTKYFSQRDNFTQALRTCNSSSNAMYLEWLQRIIGGNVISNDDEYLRRVLGVGDTTEHWVQTRVLESYGVKTIWATNANFDFVSKLLDIGFPVVVNILHRGSLSRPTGGHIILLIGKRGNNLISHDPFGTLASNYQNHNGRFSLIPENEFLIRWQGGYRILAEFSA
jgi:hypothetical protein